MLKRGQNSYVTLADADRYICERYPGGAMPRINWDSLGGIDKSRLLIRACVMVDAIPYPGRRLSRAQQLEWPRGRVRDIPVGIRHAQIETALWLSQAAADSGQQESRAQLMAEGVTSYRIGDLSETLDSSKAASGAMQAPAAAELLRRFTGGAFSLC